ncbi:hypothetical protein DFS34DRAFT_384417 [Phlyctochytrium arcticum]|nr:hypothetical protein DFS34DRAFT_384417 [Phlyctochytrium arcticum]
MDIPALRIEDPHSDVDTISDLCETVVKYGRRPGGRHRYGGLSVGTYNPPTEAHWPDTYVMEDLDTDEHGNPIIPARRGRFWKPFKVVTRWHCYLLNLGPGMDNLTLHHDDPPHHAFLYPTTDLPLTNLQSRDDLDAIPTGDLPGVGNLDWTFCCSLLQMGADDYSRMKAGEDPLPVLPINDLECQDLVGILQDFIMWTDWPDLAVTAGKIVTWFERHLDTNFHSIRSDLPIDMLRPLMEILESYIMIIPAANVAERAGYLLEFLEREV